MNVNGKVAEWPGATDIDLGIGVNEYIATMRAGRAQAAPPNSPRPRRRRESCTE